MKQIGGGNNFNFDVDRLYDSGKKKGGGKGDGKGGKGDNDGSGNPGGWNGAPEEDPEIRDAYAMLLKEFTDVGLGSLAPLILSYLQQGYGTDVITIMLEDAPEYKARFAGNEAIKQRIQNGEVGLRVLTPGEYLAQEKQYRDVLSYYGLPAGFYDQPEDFAGWIGQGVSVLEIQDRARIASEKVYNSTPEFKEALRQFYGVTDGEMAAYFLDESRALPLLQNRAAAAEIAGAAAYQGLGSSRTRAEELAEYGITRDQAREGYSMIGEIIPDAKKLAAIDKVQYDLGDAEDEVFKGDAEAARRRRKLAGNEKGRFSANSGTNEYSFSQDTGDY